MPETAFNPFQAPGDDSTGVPISHHWHGHTIRLAYPADFKTLWLVNYLTVAIDDAPPVKALFRAGRTIQLTFPHEGQQLQATVTRQQAPLP